MEQAGSSNRREYFRLGFNDLEGSMQIFEVEQNPVIVDPRPVRIINVSGGGLLVQTDVDLPIRSGVYATFQFTMAGQRYLITGYLLRKMDDLKHYYYGVQYIDMDDAVRGSLITALGKIQIERARKAKPVV